MSEPKLQGNTYTRPDGVVFSVGETVDYQDSPGQWWPGYKITKIVKDRVSGRYVFFLADEELIQGNVPPMRVRKPEEIPLTLDQCRLETNYRKALGKVWRMRCDSLGLNLGTQARMRQLEAFLQAYLGLAQYTGIMSPTRCDQIQLLVMTGRGEDYLNPAG